MSLLWLLWFVETWATFRVTRFIWRDDLWQAWRSQLKAWLVVIEVPEGEVLPEQWLDSWHNTHKRQWYWRSKAYDLLDCPWCVSIWVSAGLMLATRWLTDIGPDVPFPVWWWLSLSGVAVFWLQHASDGIHEVLIKQEEPEPKPLTPSTVHLPEKR